MKMEPAFPLYLLEIDGELRFMSIGAAGVYYGSEHANVSIMGLVIEKGYRVRRTRPEDRERICEIASLVRPKK